MTDAIPTWEPVIQDLARFKVDGGYLYLNSHHNGNTMSFVPDVDLQRYQAHLRDAYNQGFTDGQSEMHMQYQKQDTLNKIS